VKDILKAFTGKTVRVYTMSGVESYLGIIEDVKEDYLVLKSFFKDDRTYLAIQYIESFKEEKHGAEHAKQMLKGGEKGERNYR
jgi:ferredoxin-fold anticodon binding domain-containing protein